MSYYQFWVRYFRSSFIPHLERLIETIEVRLLPTLDTDRLSAEATKIQEEAREAPNQSWSDDEDGSLFEEACFEQGLDHYLGMTAVRQSLLNLSATLLYHTWEQQLLTFHRKCLLDFHRQNDHQLLTLRAVKTSLKSIGVTVDDLPSWDAIDELRLASNTVKHADGAASSQLKQMNRALFTMPSIDPSYQQFVNQRPLYMPLSGEDIYIQLEDVQRYGRAVISFWEELSEALEKTSS